jgi:hypothetical protein
VAAGGAPKDFRNQGGACVILCAYRKFTGANDIAQELPFQEMQIPRKTLHAR